MHNENAEHEAAARTKKLFGLSITHDTMEIPFECLENRSGKKKIKLYRDERREVYQAFPPNCILILYTNHVVHENICASYIYNISFARELKAAAKLRNDLH